MREMIISVLPQRSEFPSKFDIAHAPVIVIDGIGGGSATTPFVKIIRHRNARSPSQSGAPHKFINDNRVTD
jgi:hypothetical protein